MKQKNQKIKNLTEEIKKGKITNYIILFTCLMFLIMTCIIVWNSFRLYRESFYRFSNDLSVTSNTEIAYAIDGDMVERFTQKMTVDEEYELFAEELDLLFNKIENIKYLYILFDNGVPGMYTYIYDATHSQEFPGEKYALGRNETKEEYAEAAEVLAAGKAMDEAAYYNSTYGELYYTYAPVFNSEGEVVAFLGTDIDIAPLHKQMDQYVKNIILTVLIAFLSFLIIYVIMVRWILAKPMQQITESTLRLSNGELDLQLPDKMKKRGDEIGQLATAVESVADSISGLMNDIDHLFHAVRNGHLNQRANLNGYEGDYSHIVSSMNKTLDAQCRHLDTVPEAISFFDGYNYTLLYGNRVMHRFLELHQLDGNDPELLAKIISANANGQLNDNILEFLNNPADEALTNELSLTDSGNVEYIYTMSLFHINSKKRNLSGNDNETGFMLILSDDTVLVQARTAAEQASEAKGEFLSRMSHEMRTPMNAIIGMTNIAKSSDDPEKKEYCLDKIQNASKHLLSVINDILDMSKIEANKFELFYKEFNFEKMLMNVTGVVNFRAEEKAQNLIVNISEEIPYKLHGDEMRLSQIITNLLSNAIKFTPAGGTITVNANLKDEHEDMCTLLVDVTDTGIGIVKEQQSKLFHPFEQSDGSVTRKYGGTGLGLSICKKIVELMGGDIWVESELGKYSKFSFTVQVKKVKTERKSKRSPLINPENLHILAVDDSAEVRDYFTHIMRNFGFPCDVAENGYVALDLIKKCKSRPYNIIFVDWMMPDINGVELTKQIKQLMNDNAVIIMISVADWDSIRDEATEAGVSEFISKPLFPSVLMNTINEILGNVNKIRNIKPDQKLYNFHNQTVLLAEDVAINREILTTLLEDTGVTIETAVNGIEAIKLFEKQPQKYNLILMDIQMPEMDGYEATQRIREMKFPEAGQVPILAMTANVFREDVQKCLDAGMNDHIGKPVDQEELLLKVEKYMQIQDKNITQKPVVSDADKSEIRDLPIIDVETGVKRLMNNEKLYFKLLKKFIDGNTIKDLFTSIETGEPENVRLAAHSLKGVTANLALPALNSIAARIEALSKEQKPTKEMLDPLKITVDATLKAVGEILERGTANG